MYDYLSGIPRHDINRVPELLTPNSKATHALATQVYLRQHSEMEYNSREPFARREALDSSLDGCIDDELAQFAFRVTTHNSKVQYDLDASKLFNKESIISVIILDPLDILVLAESRRILWTGQNRTLTEMDDYGQTFREIAMTLCSSFSTSLSMISRARPLFSVILASQISFAYGF